jgi:hypothetical protein
MKTCILLILVTATVTALSAPTAQIEPGVPTRGAITLAAYPGMPWIDNSKLPWLNHSAQTPATQTESDPSRVAPRLNTLLGNLNADLDTTASDLTALSARIDISSASENATVEPALMPPAAADYSTLLSRDLSTLASQDLSVQCGQLLSTSLAVPTAPPWSTWGNKPGAAVVATPAGQVVMPTFPPRTAWGNGPGVVVTTPGGAVFSMMPAAEPATDPATLAAVRDVQRQLLVVQNEIEDIRPLLENLSTNRVTTPATFQQPYLTPTGRR